MLIRRCDRCGCEHQEGKLPPTDDGRVWLGVELWFEQTTLGAGRRLCAKADLCTTCAHQWAAVVSEFAREQLKEKP